MLNYIFKRLIGVVLTFFIIIAAVFFVLYSMPGNVIDDPMIKDEVRRAIEKKYHLNEPLPVQFGYFIKDYIRMDFGESLAIRPKMPVMDMIKERLPITIQLNFFAALFTFPMGLFFGISMALKKNSLYDVLASSVVIFFISAPNFIVAAILQYTIGFKAGWLPYMLAPIVELNWAKFLSMILPILALSFGNIASISRMLRAELSETLSSDYLLLAKAKGLTYKQTIIRHALRNACVPMASQFMYLFIYLISGSIVIENIFAVPGLSKILVDAINAKDHQVTLAVVYFYVLIGLVMAIAADLSYGVLDPRIRMGGRRMINPEIYDDRKFTADSLPEFDKSLFNVVKREEEIRDFAMKDKPISYIRDVFKRFVKSKVAVAAAIIIFIIVSFGIFGPSMTGIGYLTQIHDHANLPPRIPFIERLGVLDGTRVVELPTQNLEKYKDVYIRTILEFDLSVKKQIVPMSRIEIDAYKLAGAADKYYLFGTDMLGRDLFTRLWQGTRISLVLAIFVVIINLSIGLFIGSAAGYYGGWVDFFIVRAMEILNAIPTLPLTILLIMLLGAGLQTLMLVFVITGWISMSYSVRIQFYRYKKMEYVLASRTMGAGDFRIMFKHILPNAAGTLITVCALTVPSVVFQEAALSYLGLGIQAPDPSIGTLLADGQKQLFMYPYLTVFPGIVIVLLMLSFNLFGNGLRDAFNPALRQ